MEEGRIVVMLGRLQPMAILNFAGRYSRPGSGEYSLIKAGFYGFSIHQVPCSGRFSSTLKLVTSEASTGEHASSQAQQLSQPVSA